jgi:hypothetical protein
LQLLSDPVEVEIGPATIRAPNRQIRSLVLCVDLVRSRRICLLTLGASSIAPD